MLLLLSSIALLLAFSKAEDGIKLFPDDVKRFPLQTDTQHMFSVDFSSDEVQKLEGFTIQVHNQKHTVTLSESEVLQYGSYVSGRNIGLWKTMSSTVEPMTYNYYVNVSCGLTCANGPENVTVLVAVVPVETTAPIPGGCSMTSSLETDPNIQLEYTSYTTAVYFEDGNVGYDPHQENPNDCARKYDYDKPTFEEVSYSVYHKVLSVGDYSEDHMFDAIEAVLTASSMTKKKDDLPNFEIESVGVKKALIDSYQGDGVVYNVLAVVDGFPSTGYVPAVTYGCELASDSSGCAKRLDIVEIVVAVIGGLVGVFLLIGAHRLFHVEVFVFSSLIFVAVWYIVVANILSHDSEGVSMLTLRLSIALALALVCGGVMFLFWFFSGWFIPCVLLFTGSGGFIVMATLMYILSFTAADSISILKISYVYSLLFGCVIVLVLIPAVIFPRAMNIVFSSLVGSYLIVFFIGLFVFSSLSEILMRVIKNATVEGYMKSEASYAFQIQDIILAFVWLLLFVCGILIQSLLAYKRKPFPDKSLYKQCQEKIEKRRANNPSERRRLLDYTSSTKTINY